MRESPPFPSAGAREVGAGTWLCGFLEPLLGPPGVPSLSPRPRLPMELRRALGETEVPLTEEQPSASAAGPQLPEAINSRLFSRLVWCEKYLIQSTGKCFWKTLPRRERERVFVCVGVVCTLPSFLPPPPHGLRPQKACSPGPQAPTISFFATATGRW